MSLVYVSNNQTVILTSIMGSLRPMACIKVPCQSLAVHSSKEWILKILKTLSRHWSVLPKIPGLRNLKALECVSVVVVVVAGSIPPTTGVSEEKIPFSQRGRVEKGHLDSLGGFFTVGGGRAGLLQAWIE